MAYGLIGTGRSLSGSAQAGLGQAAKLETSRNMMGDQLAQAASGQRKALMGTGAGIGCTNQKSNNFSQQKSVRHSCFPHRCCRCCSRCCQNLC